MEFDDASMLPVMNFKLWLKWSSPHLPSVQRIPLRTCTSIFHSLGNKSCKTTSIPQQSLDLFSGHIGLFHLSQWLWLLFFLDREKNRFSAEISQRGLCCDVHWGMQVRPWALPLQSHTVTATMVATSRTFPCKGIMHCFLGSHRTKGAL